MLLCADGHFIVQQAASHDVTADLLAEERHLLLRVTQRQVVAHEVGAHNGKHAAVRTVQLLRDVLLPADQLPVAHVQLLAALAPRLVRHPAAQRGHVLLAAAGHGVVVVDLVRFHVHHRHRPVRVAQVYRHKDLVHRKYVEVLAPALHIGVVVFLVGDQQALHEEVVEEVRGFSAGVLLAQHLVAIFQ